MQLFEWVAALLVAAVVLNAIARRVRVPYPTFLALGGAALAFTPWAPPFSLDPALALALFVSPVLVDAAYDASPRDLKRNLKPVVGLVVGAIVVTTATVAIVAKHLRPDLPWAAAIALGAMVAPPDAVSATAVLRQIAVPRRILTILEGESLLNDATALLIYRGALGTLATGGFEPVTAIPIVLLAVVGSVVAGIILARLYLLITVQVGEPAAAVTLQFCGTFGVWILAERLGLSAVLTTVAYASVLARYAPARTPARLRVPSYAVWETAVFVLNTLAFILIGLQLKPILDRSTATQRTSDLLFAGAILAVTILVRILYVMTFTAIRRAVQLSRRRSEPAAAELSFKGAAAVSWSGMRGIVTLAAAFALPGDGDGGPAFPARDLIVLTAFVVVLGTLVLQGTTLRPLFSLLSFTGEDPVAREVVLARDRVYRAALASLADETSGAAKAIRHVYGNMLDHGGDGLAADERGAGNLRALRVRSLAAGRKELLSLRRADEIGDDAFHRIEEELDRAQLSAEAIEL